MTAPDVIRAGVYAEAGASVRIERQFVQVGGLGFRLQAALPPVDDQGSLVEALRPGAAVVPLGDESDALLAALEGWLNGPRPTHAAVLRGGAGTGKTRIASELIRRASAAGWTSGFLHASAEVSNPVGMARRPLFIVADYAEAAPSVVLRAFAALLQDQSEDGAAAAGRRRILLLVRAPRTRVSIVDELLAFGGAAADRDDVRRELRAAAEFSFLDERFGPSESGLAGIYQRAAIAFAKLPTLCAGRSARASVPACIGRHPFTTPLTVSAAALLGLLGSTTGSSGTSIEEVLDEVLAHERRYWVRQLDESRLSIEPARRDLAGALFTVAPGGDRTDGANLLRAIPELLDDALAPTRDAITGWWLAAYPDPYERVRPVEPDLLGERLIASVLGSATIQHAGSRAQSASRGAAILLRAAAHSSASGRRALLRTLTRASHDSPILRDQLKALLNAHLRAFLDDVAAESRRIDDSEPLANTLALALAEAEAVADADLEAASLVSQPRVDQTPTLLRPLVSALALAGANALDERDIEQSSRRASALGLHATVQGLLGRSEDALGAAVAAVRLRRALARREPETYLPSLAIALNTLGNRLSGVGRRADALRVSEEAVVLLTDLVAQGRDATRVDLAVALNNLAARRAFANQPGPALQAAEKSVEIFAELIAETGSDMFDSDYAMALSTLASRRNAVGESAEALSAAEESLRMRRRLAATEADIDGANIALALNNIAMIHGSLGHTDAAIAAVTEAVEIRRDLAKREPEVHLRGLARALNTLANRQIAAGRSGAIETIEEAVSMLQRLATHNREAVLPELAGALSNYAAALNQFDRPEEAVQPAREAVAALAELGETGASEVAPTLAAALITLAAALAASGQVPEAVSAAERALRIRRQLLDSNPSAETPRLIRALEALAELLAVDGDNERAAELRSEARRRSQNQT